MATGNLGIGYTQVLAKSVSHVTASKVANLGDRCLWKGDEYIYVYALTTCNIGNACVITGSTSYSVTISSVTDQENGFVGVVKHTAIPSGEYGWILQHGICPVIAGANTAISLTNQIYVVGTTSSDGNVAPITNHTAYSQMAFFPRPIGYCITSGTTERSATCLIY